jgi:hypothetical protein
VLVGTPNSGTPLASTGSLSRFLDGNVSRLSQASTRAALAPLEGALCLARFVAMGLTASLAGLDELIPGNTTLQSLGAAAATQWFTIGARYAHDGAGSLDIPGEPDFAASDNDLVVPSEGCHLAGAGEALRLSGCVHHHTYFSNPVVRERLDSWLA